MILPVQDNHIIMSLMDEPKTRLNHNTVNEIARHAFTSEGFIRRSVPQPCPQPCPLLKHPIYTTTIVIECCLLDFYI